MSGESYQSIQAGWPSQDDKETLAWGDKQAESLWRGLYGRYDPIIDGQTVLDLGCSWGYMIRYLARRFRPRSLIGVDIQPYWDTTAHGWDYRSSGREIRFYCGELPRIADIEAGSIDLVMCTSVLQYLSPSQIEATLDQIWNVLRPGGEMILRTRTFTSYIGADLHKEFTLPYVHLLYPVRQLSSFVQLRRGRPPRYLNCLTVSTYLALFIRSGLELADFRRRKNSVEPELMDRVRKAYPWISEDELLTAELEARLIRPILPHEI